MTATANTGRYPETAEAHRPTAHAVLDLDAKPRVSRVDVAPGEYHFRVVMADGRTGRMYPLPHGRWRYAVSAAEGSQVQIPGHEAHGEAYSEKHALRCIVTAGAKLEPGPWADLAALESCLGATIKQIEDDRNATTAALRKILRKRFPSAKFSVRGDRGTAWSWISIKPENWQAEIVAKVLNLDSVRPCSGVRGATVCRAAGVSLPPGWKIAEPAWD